ncbi:MAG: hypothetical protein AAGH68_10255 [Pseudomonadota bacterium]
MALLLFAGFPAPGPGVEGKTTSDAQFELFKFAVTAMIAGGVAMIWDAFKRREEAASEARASRGAQNAKRQKEIETYFRNLTKTYNQVKFERRILNHALLRRQDGTYDIFDKTYGASMDSLNELQLQLEFGKRLAELGAGALVDVGPKIKGDLYTAEQFLRAITEEYETRDLPYRDDPAGGGWVQVRPDSKLAGFVSRQVMEGRKGPKASSNFFLPMDTVYQQIADEVKRLGGSLDLPEA